MKGRMAPRTFTLEVDNTELMILDTALGEYMKHLHGDNVPPSSISKQMREIVRELRATGRREMGLLPACVHCGSIDSRHVCPVNALEHNEVRV